MCLSVVGHLLSILYLKLRQVSSAVCEGRRNDGNRPERGRHCLVAVHRYLQGTVAFGSQVVGAVAPFFKLIAVVGRCRQRNYRTSFVFSRCGIRIAVFYLSAGLGLRNRQRVFRDGGACAHDRDGGRREVLSFDYQTALLYNIKHRRCQRQLIISVCC